ncbi:MULTISPECIES: M20 metallopeptidase family protein [unclassified Sphingobacterium]|uniref:M20 metallopeptidase family protein n=1 Tax=unclassified Sphingobacterium TaxID=2609468 RepID=UPI0025D0A958|nr:MULTISPECIES: amidohydrolase [unclassified Sphingobacterium]
MMKQFNVSVKIGLLLLASCMLQACRLNKTTAISRSQIAGQAERHFAEFVGIKNHLHQYPELSGKEIGTKEFVRQYLVKLGLEVKSDLYGQSVIGILKGKKAGRKIAWRSDMDALAMDSNLDEVYKSHAKGVHHGCGHDAHMAIALGIAKVMAQNKKQMKGDVYFIFQPEEETFNGAKKMMETNFLADLGIEEIYGLHVTAFPVGQILVKPHEMFAHQREIQVQMKGITLNPEQLNKLSAVVATKLSRIPKGTNPADIQKIADPALGVASPNTMFLDYSFADGKFHASKNGEIQNLALEMYETDSAAIPNILPKVRTVLEEMGLSRYVQSISFSRENPTVMNDARLTSEAYQILRQENGTDIYLSQGQIPYFNDDFAYFQKKIPGVYFFLGGSNFSKGIVAMNHTPHFQIDDTCLKTGVSAFAYLLSRRLSE